MRLLGNAVLLQPLDTEAQVSVSGLLLVNKHRKPTLKFLVLAVGPGGWRWRKGKRKTFLTPEVSAGDLVLCRAELDSAVVKHSLDDGTGRVIVDAEHLLMTWRE